MKQLLLLMAVVGLATTGCAQNRVLGTHARRGGAGMTLSRTQSTPRQSRPSAEFNEQVGEQIELATYGGGRCRDCEDCGSATCSDGACGLQGRRAGRSEGCSACDGNGCGLCQRVAGRLRGLNPNPHAGGYPEGQNFNPAQPSGQVAYPYYTVRGPRDFLNSNPASIGPY